MPPWSTRAYVATRQRGRTKTYEKPAIARYDESENDRSERERGRERGEGGGEKDGIERLTEKDVAERDTRTGGDLCTSVERQRVKQRTGWTDRWTVTHAGGEKEEEEDDDEAGGKKRAGGRELREIGTEASRADFVGESWLIARRNASEN